LSFLEKFMKFSSLRSACLVPLLAVAGSAQSAPSAALEQRLHEEMQAVLLRLVESGELSARDAESLSLSAPHTQQADLGAILDVRFRADRDEGLPVLGVTPGGGAANLGVQPGDRIVAVNGESLVGLGADARGRAVAATRLRDGLLARPDAIELRVMRGATETTLTGSVRVVEVPAYRLDLGSALAGVALASTAVADPTSSCGRVSVFDVAPRSQRLYEAVLIAIDGKSPGPGGTDSFRLEPGPHRLTVAEAIDSRQFDAVALRQRDGRQRDRYKELEIVVQPGITYRLAARFHLEERNSIRDGAYWEPVIWRETPERCD
jgi:hypothetical protein